MIVVIDARRSPNERKREVLSKLYEIASDKYTILSVVVIISNRILPKCGKSQLRTYFISNIQFL